MMEEENMMEEGNLVEEGNTAAAGNGENGVQAVCSVETIIEKLELVPLAGEGGMYRYLYAGEKDAAGREIYSSIYYLLTERSFSHMHRLKTDEIYHYYMGDGLELLLLYPDGRAEKKVLGPRLTEGEVPQLRVPAGVWQGSVVAHGGTCCLAGTTMAPAYVDDDYEHGDCEALCAEYPAASAAIKQRCGEAVAQ